MAIQVVSSAVWKSGTGTPQTVNLPAGWAVGDIAIAYIGLKPYTVSPSVTTAGWNAVPNTAGTNGTTASGIDTGSVSWGAWYKVLESGDTNVSFSIGGVNVGLMGLTVFESTTSSSWDIPTGGKGSDTSSGTGFSITSDTSIALRTGDMLFGQSYLPGNDATFGTPTLTASGLTVASPTEEPATEGSTASGQDFESSAMYAEITAGSATVAPVMGWTLSANQTGGGAIVRIREMAVSVSDSITVTDHPSSAYTTYYFDGSDAGASDPGGVWSTDSNGFDGNIGTSTFSSTVGSNASNFLLAEGTNAPTSGGTISKVLARFYSTALSETDGEIYTNGLAESLGGLSALSSASTYSAYVTLSTPTGGWTWQKVNDLEVKMWKSAGGGSAGFSIVEIQVHEEGVTVAGGGGGGTDLNVNVSDTITITESVSVFIPELFVNKSDTITVTESIGRLLESRVSVNDSITVTENIKVELNSNVNVNDSISITENVNRLLESYINKSDNITITEAVTVLIPTLLLSVNDSITVTESINRLLESYVSKSESVTITESINRLLESYVNVNDSITVTELVTKLLESYINKSETITITESIVAFIPELALAVNDSITITESLKLLLESYINKSESITLTESVKAELNSLISVSDSVTVSENIVRLLESYVTVNDSITLTEALQRLLESYISKSESVTVTENIDLQGANLTGTTVPSATEGQIVTGGRTTIITLHGDTWIAAGAGSFDLIRQDIIDGVTSAQSEATGWNLVPKATQTIAGVVRTSDTVVTITWDAFPTYDITAQETITVTVPSTALTSGLAIVASPTFYISTDAFVDTHNVSVSDTITVTESVNLELNSRVSVADNVTLTESVNRLLESYVNKSESITVTENVDPELQSHITVSDTATLTENINRLLESYINKSESITLTEAITVLIPELYRSVSDSITITESVNRLLESYVNKSESITLTENVIAELNSAISVSDNITVTESINRLLESYVSVSDSITTTESTNVFLPELNVSVSDNVTITENVVVAIIAGDTLSLSVSDSITITENVVVALGTQTLTIRVSEVIGGSGSSPRIIILTDGRVAVRLSGNVYQAL